MSRPNSLGLVGVTFLRGRVTRQYKATVWDACAYKLKHVGYFETAEEAARAHDAAAWALRGMTGSLNYPADYLGRPWTAPATETTGEHGDRPATACG